MHHCGAPIAQSVVLGLAWASRNVLVVYSQWKEKRKENDSLNVLVGYSQWKEKRKENESECPGRLQSVEGE